MRDKQLSRRRVLGALATTGSAGALVGTGTGALFSDEETFTNNGITASKSVAGVVDVDVEANVLEGGTGVVYDITLPEGVNNNPSYIWFRTGCPDPLELGCATEIEIREECDGTTDTIATGSARDALNALRDGTLLCSGGDTCLQPGETQTLEIEVDGVDDGYDGPDGPLEFDIEFYGAQCRYNTGAENPFGDYKKCESCDVSTGGGPSESTGKGISFIAFCSESGGDINPEITDVVARNDEGEPISVDWETTSGVDYVVVKSGQNFTIYKYGSATEGTATTGGDSDAAYYSSEPPNSRSSEPCELAADKVGDGDFADDGTSTKLQDDKGEIEP